MGKSVGGDVHDTMNFKNIKSMSNKHKMRLFESGAIRDNDDDKLDLEGFYSPLVVKRFAEYMHKHRIQADGGLRASDNWQRGISKEVYIFSRSMST